MNLVVFQMTSSVNRAQYDSIVYCIQNRTLYKVVCQEYDDFNGDVYQFKKSNPSSFNDFILEIEG